MSKMAQYQIQPRHRFPNLRPDGTKQCVWCGKSLQGRRQRWCSRECVDDYTLHTDWNSIRRHVRERDLGVCAICGIDTYAEKEKWRGLALARREGRGLPSKPYAIPMGVLMLADDELREAMVRHGWPRNTDRDWWEADHIIPQEQGGEDHPRNLRTLCVPCHKAVSAMQAAERAKRKRQNDHEQLSLKAQRSQFDADHTSDGR